MSSVPARPASTVVLLRPADPFDVFLVRRSDSIAFMGGAHVFPGGRVDEGDRVEDVSALSVGSEEAAARMQDVPRDIAVAHHVAALRELFEEAGVLLARPLGAASLPVLEQRRRDLLAGTMGFADVIRQQRLRLALDELAYFAHWVTPEIETRRFDTRFFIARAPQGQTPMHDAGETSHSEWLSPLAAIEQCQRGAIALPPPTWTTLSMLARFRSIDDVLDWARQKAIPRVQPRFERRGEQTLLFYPGDPMYPRVDGFDAAETRFILENKRWRPITPD